MEMKLLVELPDYGISAKGLLYPDRAPRRCAAIWESLKVPFVTKTRHAIFEGYEIYAFLPPFKEIPPMENQTMRPKPGDITNFVLGKKDYACMAWSMFDDDESHIYELNFIYGEADFRYFYEEGQRASLVGRIVEGYEEFAKGCGRTLVEGQTTLRISRFEG